MGDRLIKVQAAEHLSGVVSIMNEAGSGSAFVEDSGKVAGLITEKEIIKFVETSRHPSKVTVREIMSSLPVKVSEETSVDEAVQLMLDFDTRRLPVYRDEILVGMVTSTNILKAISKGLLAREIFIYLSDIFKKEDSSVS